MNALKACNLISNDNTIIITYLSAHGVHTILFCAPANSYKNNNNNNKCNNRFTRKPYDKPQPRQLIIFNFTYFRFPLCTRNVFLPCSLFHVHFVSFFFFSINSYVISTNFVRYVLKHSRNSFQRNKISGGGGIVKYSFSPHKNLHNYLDLFLKYFL